MPDVAIAIVSYNTRALLDECLTSLRADADAGRAEVWVVDNASTDGSADMVELIMVPASGKAKSAPVSAMSWKYPCDSWLHAMCSQICRWF